MGNNFKFPHEEYLPNDLTINNFGETPDEHAVNQMCRCLPFSEILKMQSSELHDKIDWYSVTKNINITIEMIIEHPELPWNMNAIYQKENITFEDVLKYPHIFNNWNDISRLQIQGITPNVILNNLNLPWNWVEISTYWSFGENFVEKHPELPWNYDCLSKYNSVSLDFVEKHPELPWNYKMLSNSIYLTIDFVVKHQNKDWNWFTIMTRDLTNSLNCNVHTPNKCFNIDANIFKQLFKTHYRKILDTHPIACFLCDHLTLDMVLSNANANWDWGEITDDAFVTMNVMKNYPNLPWNYNELHNKYWYHEQHDYVNTEIGKLLLLTIYESYESLDAEQFEAFDYVFHDNYLLKTISKFL